MKREDYETQTGRSVWVIEVRVTDTEGTYCWAASTSTYLSELEAQLDAEDVRNWRRKVRVVEYVPKTEEGEGI